MISLSVLPWVSLAGTKDFKQPIKVDAASQFVDGKNKISLFKDDVSITQGSLKIDASEVEVNASKGEGKEVFIARGNPANYQQKMEDGTLVKAQANEIRYEVNKRLISLKGNAELQQDSSSVKGDTISYDMNKEQLLATSSDKNSKGRVTTVFRPETVKKINEQNEVEASKQDKEKP
ncbi:lipopolysaccharide transport periplasmic protein LptA [Alteromonas sp. ASW11-130]|uniref:lipopolysaccharide transport periplasmic protein LptA n=1 Tax=Alteromonas sp. ASW11-130 TaxID=3015775 RepID=UPI002242B04A|nr:lipopolysaccharide transport periplasmic protein LptA [Alteromonas sp. ASW11-130]MCW8090451.1 lipopolysaccharide transport periplasmic protein LptA [Alteromonas sp. ASW11-130]